MGVWWGRFINYSFVSKELVEFIIDIFISAIISESLDIDFELSLYHSKEFLYYYSCIGFVFQEVYPSKLYDVIDEGNVVFLFSN